ncbi:hypothetical protein L1987_47964 [Smallanthus sonchifolius]|uniref:Uncharacterized protein n=1 Tax=Smallanthus sonchifolius TaxID=185202 RepID=A0ACB9FRI7_9ASTR|nr:hypothetical protein L1987_47964 [Smallanthus sonchifolius]
MWVRCYSEELHEALRAGGSNAVEYVEEDSRVFTRGSWCASQRSKMVGVYSLFNKRYITYGIGLKQSIMMDGWSTTRGESTPEIGGLFGWKFSNGFSFVVYKLDGVDYYVMQADRTRETSGVGREICCDFKEAKYSSRARNPFGKAILVVAMCVEDTKME